MTGADDPKDEQEVWFWRSQDATWWAEDCWLTPAEATARGYRYLGPAEWQSDDTRKALEQANYEVKFNLNLNLNQERSRLANRIAELEAEVARLTANTQAAQRAADDLNRASGSVEPASFPARALDPPAQDIGLRVRR